MGLYYGLKACSLVASLAGWPVLESTGLPGVKNEVARKKDCWPSLRCLCTKGRVRVLRACTDFRTIASGYLFSVKDIGIPFLVVASLQVTDVVLFYSAAVLLLS